MCSDRFWLAKILPICLICFLVRLRRDIMDLQIIFSVDDYLLIYKANPSLVQV